MNSSFDQFEEQYEFIKYISTSHMASFPVNTHLTSILGYSDILLKEINGPINTEQRELLGIIHKNAERLQEYLQTFIISSRLLFDVQELYIGEFDLAETIKQVIDRLEVTTEYQIEKDIQANLPKITGDGNLIHSALMSIGGLIKQIHPTYKGHLDISVKSVGDSIEALFSTAKGEGLQVENNPELFIAQSIAKMHNGGLIINDHSDSRLDVKFIIAIQTKDNHE